MPILIGVISGKGGTGKTTVSLSLAIALAESEHSVGLLDIDLTGPNITDVLGHKPLQIKNSMLVPALADKHNIRYISLGQIASEGDPVLWSGKNLKDASKQLLERTIWGDVDYIVVDFPPGTGSETQSLLPLMNFVAIVTVPSVLAESNVARIIELCRETQTPIIGLVKNMTHFLCGCGERTDIFPEDHSFEEIGVPTVAEFPLMPRVARAKHINDFPLDTFFEQMKNPIVLPLRKQSAKHRLMVKFLKGLK